MSRRPLAVPVAALLSLALSPAWAGGTVTLGGPAFDVFNPSKELLGQHADEPTMAAVPRADGKPDDVLMSYGTRTLRTEFDDSTSPATTKWSNVTDIVNDAVNQTTDPILAGNDYAIPGLPTRVWTSELAQSTLLIAWTDDAGLNWDFSEGGGHPNGADNQSVAAGPYPEGSLIPHPLYPHAVYYCSHAVVNAFCARSDDGGHTWGAATPIFPVEALCSNHGHVKVGGDGTVYVPMNNSCQGAEGVSVSVDAGLTWHYIKVPGTSNGRWDSSIAIANDGKTIYYGYGEQGKDHPMILKGVLDKSNASSPKIVWDALGATDVGAPAGINNIVFSAVVAGDPDRAAYAFHGTTTRGDSGSDTLMAKAEWYLYVATTYDGGANWELRQVQPDDPVQRRAICDQGIGCPANPPNRNLLDFMDAVIDSKGRILVGYADGCIGPCLKPNGPPTYADRGAIARQSGGKPLLAKFDNDPAFAPKALAAPAKDEPVEESACVAPGITVVTDSNGDPLTGPAQAMQPYHDIEWIALAEPGDLANHLVFTLKVAGLPEPLPPQTRWVTYFTMPDETNWFVAMTTADGPTPKYTYGKATTLETPAAPVGEFETEGTLDGHTEDGRIVIALDKAKVGGAAPGTLIFNIYAKTRSSTTDTNGAQGVTMDDSSTGAYEVVGNESCKPKAAPVAKAIASRHSGAAPFTVAIDASMSEDLAGKGVDHYVFNFGDGTVVTSQDGVVQHRYENAGAYRTTVTAFNRDGDESYNRAKLTFLVGQDLADTGALNEKGGYNIFAGALGLALLLPLAGLAALRRRVLN